jgi:hypothetical protein
VAAPLNDGCGASKWWTPRVEAAELRFEGSKASNVELAHLWTIPNSGEMLGELGPDGQNAVAKHARKYYSVT